MKISMQLALLSTVLVGTITADTSTGEKYYRKLATIEECEKIYHSPRCPSVIVFNSTTCSACEQMEPVLNNAARKYTRAKFYTYTVPEKGSKEIHKRGIFKIPSYPTTYFVKPRAQARREGGSMCAAEFDSITYEHVYGKPKPVARHHSPEIKKSLQERIENTH